MAPKPERWHCIAAATRAVVPRVPLRLAGVDIGSVAVEHLPRLRAFAALQVADDGVALSDAAAFDAINAALRADGLIRGWRDEVFSVFDPATLAPLGRIERAAARLWGLLTLGAHATGYVADAAGRPQALWIAQRSFAKATDPGLFDNMVGGGVAAGDRVAATLVREAAEEAGLTAQQVGAPPCRAVLRLARDVAEGFQHERLYAYDIALPSGVVPRNRDGEVHAFSLLPAADALALAATDAMTVDAALVTLDFALRHRLMLRDAAPARQIAPLRLA